jgi:hypothetical protein
LGALGVEVVPVLVEVLQNKKSANAISRAADAIAIIGPEAKAAVPLLSQALKVDNGVEWRSPIIALGRIGPEARPAIPAMIDFLGDYLKSGKYKPVSIFESTPLPVTFIEALSEINPEIKGILPKGIYDAGGSRSRTGVNMDAPVTLWQQAYDALKAKYPTHVPAPLPDSQPKEGGSGDTAAKGGLDGNDQEPCIEASQSATG